MKKFKVMLFSLLMIMIPMLSSCGKSVDFQLKFYVDDEIYSTIDTNGNEAIALPENPTKEGYIFYGWYWDKDVWKEPFTANSLLNVSLSSDMGVYARFIDENTVLGTNVNFDDFERVNSTTFSISVSNETETLIVSDYINVDVESSWELCTDISANESIKSKVATLAVGDNTYYVLVTDKNDNVKLYTLKIRRRPIYEVVFFDYDGTLITAQQIEEGGCAVVPEVQRENYTFITWGEGYDAPIMKNSEFVAVYEPIKYAINYYNCDGAINENPVYYTVESGIINLSEPLKDYYEFEGWFDNEGLAGTEIKSIQGGSVGSINLYAYFWSFEEVSEFDPYSLISLMEDNTSLSDFFDRSDNSLAKIEAHNASTTVQYYYLRNTYETFLKPTFSYVTTMMPNHEKMPSIYCFEAYESLQGFIDIAASYGIDRDGIIFDNDGSIMANFEKYPLLYRPIQAGEYGYVPGYVTYYKYESIPYEMVGSGNYQVYVLDNDVTADEQMAYDFMYFKVISDSEYEDNKEWYVNIPAPINGEININDQYFINIFKAQPTATSRYRRYVEIFSDGAGNSCIYLKYKKSETNYVYIQEDLYEQFIIDHPTYQYIENLIAVDFESLTEEEFAADYYEIVPGQYPQYYVSDYKLYFKNKKIQCTGNVFEKYIEVEDNPVYEKKIVKNGYVQNKITNQNAIFVVDDAVSMVDRNTYQNEMRNFIPIKSSEFKNNRELYDEISIFDDNYNLKYTLYYKWQMEESEDYQVYSYNILDFRKYKFIDILDADYREGDYVLIESGSPDYVEGKELYYKKVVQYRVEEIVERNYYHYESEIKKEFKKGKYYALSFDVTTTGNVQTSFYFEAMYSMDRYFSIENIQTNGETQRYTIFIYVENDDSYETMLKMYLGNEHEMNGSTDDEILNGVVDYDNLKVQSITQRDYENQTIWGMPLRNVEKHSIIL